MTIISKKSSEQEKKGKSRMTLEHVKLLARLGSLKNSLVKQTLWWRLRALAAEWMTATFTFPLVKMEFFLPQFSASCAILRKPLWWSQHVTRPQSQTSKGTFCAYITRTVRYFPLVSLVAIEKGIGRDGKGEGRRKGKRCVTEGLPFDDCWGLVFYLI